MPNSRPQRQFDLLDSECGDVWLSLSPLHREAQYWLELVDSKHRYGTNLKPYQWVVSWSMPAALADGALSSEANSLTRSYPFSLQ